jgi:hypothetical protein
MKRLRLFSLVSITSIALAQAAWAGHGGGGGGFGGGGFGGGHVGGFGGGTHFGGSGFVGPSQFGGGFHAPGPSRIVGVGTRGGGVGFGTGRYSPYMAAPSSTIRSTTAGRGVSRSVRATASRHPTAPVTTPNRAPNTAPVARSSGNIAQRGLNGRTDHISERHPAANWHSDWDRHHAHYFHHRFFVFEDGIWFGLDDGFYPWDYYPYYAFDYYPYDYYPGYYADVEPYYSNAGVTYDNLPSPDPTVTAVQTRLTQLGYYNGPADGIYGPLTRDAVARYQTGKNLQVTGNLSTVTLQSLGVPGLASN